MLNTIFDQYCKLLTFLCVCALAIMVVLVFGNVVLRYGFNSGLTMSEELSRWLFVWLTFMGAVVALNERTHLGTDMMVARLPVLGKKICLSLSNTQSVIMSKKGWDSLSPADRKLIDDAADESTQFQRKEARAAVSANLDLVKKNGIAVTQLSSAEQDKLREKMKPVIAKFSASVGESTVSEMMAELAKLRK